MASRSTWVEVLAGFKMLYDLVKLGPDRTLAHLKYLGNPETYAEAGRMSAIYSTSSSEMRELVRDIEECRDRLMAQASRKQGAEWVCSIFDRIKAGNGGTLPLIDDWHLIYLELQCESKD